MDIRKIKKLIELLEESGLAELEISEGEEKVRIARGGAFSVTALAAGTPPPRSWTFPTMLPVLSSVKSTPVSAGTAPSRLASAKPAARCM